MRRVLLITLGVWLVAGAALSAADFWEEQPFTEWSDKNVQKMLNDSPWAQQVRIAIGNLSEDALPTAAQPDGPPEDCGGTQFGGIQRHRLAVVWTSVLPVKQALVRQASGLGGPVPAESQQMLDQTEPFYAVTLFGIPPSLAVLGSMRDTLMSETELRRKDRQPIVPEDVRLFQNADDGLIRVIFLFPKSDVITSDDKDVELVTRLVDSEVKKKFKLENMVFQNQLEL
jgi:hypothetical protein